MLRLRHRQDELDTEQSVTDEARIREDERRRVLAEMARDDHDRTGDRSAARDDRMDDRDRMADHDVDWRDAPPPFGEAPVEDPTATSARTNDPRHWDVPNDRWDDDRHDGAMAHDDRTMVRDERVVAVPAREPAVVEDDIVTERGFSPGQILIVLAGAASLALGIAAVARTGLDGPLSEPVEQVLWWDHTALLGLIEIGAGALMILSGLRAGARWIGGLIGIAAIVGGALILGQLDWTVNELGAERDFGWVAIGIGAAAVIGALIPRVRRTRRVSTTRSMLS